MIHTLVIRGDRALFARPDATDPHSYPLPPPSAVRGVAEKVYWHPGLYIDTKEIAVLAPIRWDREGIVEIRGKKSSTTDPLGPPLPKLSTGGVLTAPVPLKRTSTCVLLSEPAWRVKVQLRCKPYGPQHVGIGEANAIFSRRLDQGQLYACPYLGQARFRAIVSPATGDEDPISVTRDFGQILHDIDYRCTPPVQHVFHAKMIDGVVKVPSFFDSVLSRKKVA